VQRLGNSGGGVPVPFSVTFCGLNGALSLTETEPVRVPRVVGLLGELRRELSHCGLISRGETPRCFLPSPCPKESQPGPEERHYMEKGASHRPATDQNREAEPNPLHQRVRLSAQHARAPCQRLMSKTSRSQSPKITTPTKTGITILMNSFCPILSMRWGGRRRILLTSALKLVEIIL
jgi:hypothetical protein